MAVGRMTAPQLGHAVPNSAIVVATHFGHFKCLAMTDNSIPLSLTSLMQAFAHFPKPLHPRSHR